MRQVLGSLMLLASASLGATFQLPSTITKHHHNVIRARQVVAADGLDDYISSRWKFLLGKDAADRITEVAGADAMAEKAEALRDAKLAERNTKEWCLDRCLATGY